MKTDFKNAYQRHHKDAETLFAQNRYPNADQLYGLAAECAIKAVMVGIAPSLVDNNGDFKNQSDKLHVNLLWSHFGRFIHGRSHSAYCSILPISLNPFQSWSINQRYAHQKHVRKRQVEIHRIAVNQSISKLIAEARANGHW